MIRRARALVALVLMVAGVAQAASAAEVHDLFVVVDGRLSVKLRLRIEAGSQSLALREEHFLREWFAHCAGGPEGRLDARTAERAVRNNPLNRLLSDTRVQAKSLHLEPGAIYTAEDLARRWVRQSSGRFLQLDLRDQGEPYGEALTRALVATLDQRRTGRVSKESLQSEKILLAKCDEDEDECITPFELVPSLLTVERHGPMRKLPALVLLHPGQTEDDCISALLAACAAGVPQEEAIRWLRREPDAVSAVRLDDPKAHRQLFRAGGWYLDLAPQAMIPDPALVPDRKVADSIVTLTVAPQPRSWFAILDADGDGQLSVPELRNAWERLADDEARKVGFVTPPAGKESYLTLTFARGSHGWRGIPLTKRPGHHRGPDWFQAMDRNGDGCLSPREFIGTREQFRRLDRDGDGLLSPEEAEAPR